VYIVGKPVLIWKIPACVQNWEPGWHPDHFNEEDITMEQIVT
jgi:hypothetical protein